MPSIDECLQSVKDGFVDRISMLEMLYHDALQQRRSHSRIPDPLGINDDDRSLGAHAETWGLTALYARRTEEKVFALQQLGEQRINLPATTIGGAEIAGAYEHVARIRLHLRLRSLIHSAKIQLAPRRPLFAPAHLVGEHANDCHGLA